MGRIGMQSNVTLVPVTRSVRRFPQVLPDFRESKDSGPREGTRRGLQVLLPTRCRSGMNPCQRFARWRLGLGDGPGPIGPPGTSVTGKFFPSRRPSRGRLLGHGRQQSPCNHLLEPPRLLGAHRRPDLVSEHRSRDLVLGPTRQERVAARVVPLRPRADRRGAGRVVPDVIRVAPPRPLRVRGLSAGGVDRGLEKGARARVAGIRRPYPGPSWVGGRTGRRGSLTSPSPSREQIDEREIPSEPQCGEAHSFCWEGLS